MPNETENANITIYIILPHVCLSLCTKKSDDISCKCRYASKDIDTCQHLTLSSVHHRLESQNLLQMMFQTRASQLGKFMVRKHCCDSDGFRVTLLRRTRNFLSVRSWFGQTRFPLSFPLTFLKVSAEGMIIWKNKLVGGFNPFEKY